MSLPELPAIRTALTTFFATRTDVTAALVSGSVARGKTNALSDVDVAVLLRDPKDADRDPLYAAKLLDGISRALKTDDVDLVLLHQATPLLIHEVFRDGIVVHDSDPDALVDFRTRSLLEYLDTKPLREMRSAALLERIDQGTFGTR